MNPQELINDVVAALRSEPQTATEMATTFASSGVPNSADIRPWHVLCTLAVLYEDGQVRPLQDGGLWALTEDAAEYERRLAEHRRDINAEREARSLRCVTDDVDDILAALHIEFTYETCIRTIRAANIADLPIYPVQTIVVAELENGDEMVAEVLRYLGGAVYELGVIDEFYHLSGRLCVRAQECKMYPWVGSTDTLGSRFHAAVPDEDGIGIVVNGGIDGAE